MKQVQRKSSGTYRGYQILLSTALTGFVLAGLFTHIIRNILRVLILLAGVAFWSGWIGCADKLKRAGWEKPPLYQRLLQIPLYGLLLWLASKNIPLIIKSILAGAILFTILSIIKPKERKEANQI